MNKNENENMEFNSDSHSESSVTDYDETIGFFSDSFYKRIISDESKSSEAVETNIDVADNSHLGSDSPDTSNTEKKLQPEHNISANQDTEEIEISAESAVCQESGEVAEPDAVNNRTYNCFFTEKNDVITESTRKDISKKEFERKEPSTSIKTHDEKILETDAECKSVDGVSYSFFISEKERIVKENAKKKKMYTILSCLCGALFFLIIPLFLLPVFILKCVKCDKEIKFNFSTNYNTLKWGKIKSASSYEVYKKSENGDVFRILSMTVQPKCTLPRGTNYYFVIAKKNTSIIAVSEVTSITI